LNENQKKDCLINPIYFDKTNERRLNIGMEA